jgi:hypothetical protein
MVDAFHVPAREIDGAWRCARRRHPPPPRRGVNMIRHANPRNVLQHGNSARFLGDLIKGKRGASNFIFTGCSA